MYIDLLPDDGLVLKHLRDNLDVVKAAVSHLSDEQLCTPHAPGEWTIKEILLHVVDDERIYAYRALRFARNDATDLPGFDQDPYATYSEANARSLDSLFAEYDSVRAATLTLFENLPDAAFTRAGTADGNRVSVRALAYHIAGHELHHLNSIRENYLS
jgi:uncharacterized damage-inducible protein DinB